MVLLHKAGIDVSTPEFAETPPPKDEQVIVKKSEEKGLSLA